MFIVPDKGMTWAQVVYWDWRFHNAGIDTIIISPAGVRGYFLTLPNQTLYTEPLYTVKDCRSAIQKK